MKKSYTRSAAALGLSSGLIVLAGAVAAAASVTLGDKLGTSEDQIRTALEAQGYVIEEIEAEDGGFEVEAVLNGQSLEIYLDGETGAVTEMEAEDDDDDNDDYGEEKASD